MGGVTRPPAVPLARLLGMGFRQLVDDLHVRLVERGWHDVRDSYGYVLLALRDHDATTTELAGVLGVSKQATSKLLDAMEAGRYVRRRADDQDGRVKTIALGKRGHDLLAAVEEIYAELEEEWAGIIGRRGVEQMRTQLGKVLHVRHDGQLPRMRPT